MSLFQKRITLIEKGFGDIGASVGAIMGSCKSSPVATIDIGYEPVRSPVSDTFAYLRRTNKPVIFREWRMWCAGSVCVFFGIWIVFAIATSSWNWGYEGLKTLTLLRCKETFSDQPVSLGAHTLFLELSADATVPMVNVFSCYTVADELVRVIFVADVSSVGSGSRVVQV